MPADPRVHVTVRLGTTGVRWVEDVMVETSSSRTEVLRAALTIAARHVGEVRAVLKEQM